MKETTKKEFNYVLLCDIIFGSVIGLIFFCMLFVLYMNVYNQDKANFLCVSKGYLKADETLKFCLSQDNAIPVFFESDWLGKIQDIKMVIGYDDTLDKLNNKWFTHKTKSKVNI